MRSRHGSPCCLVARRLCFAGAVSILFQNMKHAAGLLSVQELSSKPFIQRALQSPKQPESVLSFFFGADYFAGGTPESVQDGSCLQQMNHFWFGGGATYDALCQPFAEAVRDAGQRKLPSDSSSSWDTTVQGRVAQMLLTDQLSRNIFRGSDEAFAYEEASLDLARQLAHQALGNTTTTSAAAAAAAATTTKRVDGEFYPPYFFFMVTALMHSEQLPDHEDLCLPLADYAKSQSSDDLNGWWDFQKSFATEHMQVIQRFDRYPHRNKFKGRESTPEEVEWLADTDKLPDWAKSMG